MTARTTRLRMLGVLLGAGVGALAGATIGWAPVRALGTPATEGAGYGGNAGALQVQVTGEQVTVTGSGFMARSTVVVSAGDITRSVTADEFGTVHAVLAGTSSSSVTPQQVVATGTATDGTATTHTPPSSPARSGAAPTAVGAAVGAAPFVVRRRRRRPA